MYFLLQKRSSGTTDVCPGLLRPPAVFRRLGPESIKRPLSEFRRRCYTYTNFDYNHGHFSTIQPARAQKVPLAQASRVFSGAFYSSSEVQRQPCGSSHTGRTRKPSAASDNWVKTRIS